MPNQEHLDPAERDRLTTVYADKALAILRQTRKASYFDDQAQIKHLKEDPDMQSLRSRKDFQEFVAKLGAN